MSVILSPSLRLRINSAKNLTCEGQMLRLWLSMTIPQIACDRAPAPKDPSSFCKSSAFDTNANFFGGVACQQPFQICVCNFTYFKQNLDWRDPHIFIIAVSRSTYAQSLANWFSSLLPAYCLCRNLPSQSSLFRQ